MTKIYTTVERSGPRPLALYYAMLQHGSQWRQFAQQNPMFGNIFEQVVPCFELPPESHLFAQGVDKYRNYPWQRPRPEDAYETVARFGRVSLQRCREDIGRPVLIVPSFINKPAILDLLPGTSFVQALFDAGFTPYILDWGTPSMGNLLTVDNAVSFALLQALAYFKEPLPLIGYCMGGLMALGAAALAPDKISQLALLATPWDFSVTPTHKALNLLPWPLEPVFSMTPLVPADAVQTLFVELDPHGAFQRMGAFATLEDEASLQRLTAIEDWLADGQDLDPAIAQTLICTWHKANQPVLGMWTVAGVAVRPQNIEVPTCVVIAEKDKLVPPSCTAPLLDLLPHATRLDAPTGHVGLMSGRRAVEDFYTPFLAWLKEDDQLSFF